MRWISITAIGSTPANGSSSRMKRGCVASARAISTRRRSPPDSAGAGEARSFSIDRSRSSPSSSSSITGFFSGRPSASTCSSSTARMFSSTVSLRKIDGSCGRYDRPRRERWWIGMRSTRRPSMRDLAGVGAHQADDHVEARRLAGAVRAEQADHLAAARPRGARPSTTRRAPYDLRRPRASRRWPPGSARGRRHGLASERGARCAAAPARSPRRWRRPPPRPRRRCPRAASAPRGPGRPGWPPSASRRR